MLMCPCREGWLTSTRLVSWRCLRHDFFIQLKGAPGIEAFGYSLTQFQILLFGPADGSLVALFLLCEDFLLKLLPHFTRPYKLGQKAVNA